MKWLHDIKRIYQSFKYAFEGISYVIATERNMKVHISVALMVLILSFLLDIPRYQLLLVFFSIVFVMCMELINTALEKVVDLTTKEFHPIAKIAKDVAAGAVLFAAIFAFMIGVYVFTDPFLALLKLQPSFPIDRIIIVIMLSLLIAFILKRVNYFMIFIVIATLLMIMSIMMYNN